VNNDATCNQHLGGAYPEDGHYFDCSTKGAYAAAALKEIKTLVTQFANVTAKLKAANFEFYVFDNAVLYPTYSAASGTCCNISQKQAFYTQFGNTTGVSTNPALVTNTQASIVSLWILNPKTI
jgi:hypothetical protein